MATSIIGTGGDYATLALWEDWADGTGVSQTASCLSGSDLQPVTISGAGWSGRLAVLEAATGHRHDGIKGSGVGAYAAVPDGLRGVDNYINGTVIDGIRLIANGTGRVTFGIASYDGAITGVLVKNCLIELSAAANCLGIGIGSIGGTTSSTVQNCMVYGNGGSGSQYGIQAYSAGLASATVSIINCSVGNMSSNTDRGGIDCRTSGGTLTTTLTNCVSIGAARCFNKTTQGTNTIVASNNLSSDATADDWGGSGHLINQTATDVVVNPASDLHLVPLTSPAIGAGNKVLDFDALGNPRGTPDDMGALTTYVAATTAALFYYYRRLRAR